MAFLILFSSMGFTFYGHECKITHKKEISLQTIKACCGETTNLPDNQLILKKIACCKLTKEFKKVDTNQKVEFSKSFLKITIEFISPILFDFSFSNSSIVEDFQQLAYGANAPPSTTLKRLSLLQTYRI